MEPRSKVKLSDSNCKFGIINKFQLRRRVKLTPKHQVGIRSIVQNERQATQESVGKEQMKDMTI